MLYFKAVYQAVLFLSVFQLTHTECPNACSAHGKCVGYDMCECYRKWMGNDCSQRKFTLNQPSCIDFLTNLIAHCR